MKSFWKSLLAATAAAAFTLTFAGCGETDPPAKLESLSFTEETAVLTVGEQKQTSLSFEPLGYAVKVSYKTSDESVAAVGETGTVTAVGEGYAQITAKAETCIASIVVQVIEKPAPPALDQDETLSAFEGEGTEASPYKIATKDDLNLLSKLVIAGTEHRGLYFEQTADIDLENELFTPVGLYGLPFEGIYDGKNHKVENIRIETTSSYQGMFGYLAGTVKNVVTYGKMSVHFTSAYSHSYVGGVVGGMNNNAYVLGCKSYVDIDGDSYLGGIVGGVHYLDDYLYRSRYSEIRNCEFYGTVTADGHAAVHERAMYFGGIAGWCSGIVTDCHNYGTLDVETSDDTAYVGGILGYHYYPYRNPYPNAFPVPEDDYDLLPLRDCVNEGSVTGGYGTGGIVGDSAIPIYDCENKGEVHGFNCVGGIIGINGTTGTYKDDFMSLNDSVNRGKVVGELRNTGGIAGYSYARVKGCQNHGETESGYYVGGIVGYLNKYSVEGCENDASVTARYGVGGIVGWAYSDSELITGCTNRGEISSKFADESGCHVGGVVGMLGSSVTVTDCDNYGTVRGGGGDYTADKFTEEGGSESRTGGTGGIAGSLYRGSVITLCNNYGAVSGYIYVGGVFGFSQLNSASRIEDCVNDANVSSACAGTANVGGVAGYVSGAGTLRNCTTYGDVTAPQGATNVDEVIGYKSSNAIVESVVHGAKE